MKKNYVGIDYSLGRANVDDSSGIHYGVISIHKVFQAWADSSEPYYGPMECAGCGDEITMDMDECPNCGANLSTEFENMDIEPSSFYIDDGEYSAEQGYDDLDIFIMKSPYFTTCQFCSPCAPGAGYIMNTVDGGIKTYCFGHDFFENGKAPYPVYDVKTCLEAK